MASALPSFHRGATRLGHGMRGPRLGSFRAEPRDPCPSRAFSCVGTGLAPTCAPTLRWFSLEAWSRRNPPRSVRPPGPRGWPALVDRRRVKAIWTKLRSPRRGRPARSWRVSRCRCRRWILPCCGQPCRCRPPPSRASRRERSWRCAKGPAWPFRIGRGVAVAPRRGAVRGVRFRWRPVLRRPALLHPDQLGFVEAWRNRCRAEARSRARRAHAVLAGRLHARVAARHGVRYS